jgi:hypothetical protein
LFRVNPDGSGFFELLNFDIFATGAAPGARLTVGADGNLYGTTYFGGSANGGTVFRLLLPSGPNTPPVAKCKSVTVPAGKNCAADASIDDGSYDPDGDPILLTQAPAGPYPLGQTLVTLTASDCRGASSSCAAVVTVQDMTPPFITAPPPKVVIADPSTCGAIVSGIGPVSAGDNCSGASIAYALTGATTGIGINDADGTVFNQGVTTVTYTITDAAGLTASCSFTVTVTNPNPVVTLTGPVSGALFAANTPVTFTATFTDDNGGTHSGTWMFDKISQTATIVEPTAGGAASPESTPGAASATYTFTNAGVYSVNLTVTDNCGGAGTASQVAGLELLVVVYDPSAGFVTGGGWIMSPPGAYTPDPTLAGKANFGFVSRYQKGQTVPTGDTEFFFTSTAPRSTSRAPATSGSWCRVRKPSSRAPVRSTGVATMGSC